MNKNKEGYKDPTVAVAIKRVDRLPKHVSQVVRLLHLVASLTGFTIVGRIRLKDKETGKEYR